MILKYISIILISFSGLFGMTAYPEANVPDLIKCHVESEDKSFEANLAARGRFPDGVFLVLVENDQEIQLSAETCGKLILNLETANIVCRIGKQQTEKIPIIDIGESFVSADSSFFIVTVVVGATKDFRAKVVLTFFDTAGIGTSLMFKDMDKLAVFTRYLEIFAR